MLAFALGILCAGEPQEPTHAAVQQSAASGLQFLVRSQHDDGGWPTSQLLAHDRLADTALAGLALVAAGERIDGGRFHPALRSAVRFVQERIPPRGCLRVERPRPGPWQYKETWYAAFAALLLAEVQAVTPHPDLAESLQRLQARLAFLQKEEGGWCHDLTPRIHEVRGLGRAEYSEDLAAAGYFVLAALESMRRVGIDAGDAVQERGIRWLERLCNDDGGVAYGLHHTWPGGVLSEPGRTAGALWALAPQWGRCHPKAIAAARYVDARFRELPNSEGHGGHEFLISHFAGAMACRAWNDEATSRYRQVFAPILIRRQHDDGRFVLGNGAWDTPANNTAIAVLSLLSPEAPLRCAFRARPPDDAAARGVRRLLATRGPDGAWRGKWGDRQMDLAITAMAVRALCAEDPLGGPERARPSLDWLCREVTRLHGNGFVDAARSHFGFQLPVVLQALVACVGDPACRTAAEYVVDELVRSQRDDGGHGYDAGELYTLCVATSEVTLALMAAARVGLAVDTEVQARMLDYLERCQGEGGGFRYCPDPAHPILAKERTRYLREEAGRTVGAIAALVQGGRGESAAVRRGREFLTRELRHDTIGDDDRHLWFFLLQDAGVRPAMTPELRKRWRQIVSNRLVSLQRDDGSFPWPGMQWSDVLGMPAMHEPYATAAGTLIAAWQRLEQP